ARLVGAVTSAEIGRTLRLLPQQGNQGLEDLDKIFTRVRSAKLMGEIDYIGVVKPDGQTVVRSVGRMPQGPYPFPVEACELDRGEALLRLRCQARDKDIEGILVAGFRRDALLREERENRLIGLVSLAIAVSIGLILAMAFSRALAEPVVQVTRAAREVASGDVTVSPVEVAAASEITSMAHSFNEMLANLRQLVSQMVSLTERLSGASKGLIGASKDQEHVTTQQAAYAQQIAATFEELSRTAEQISSSTDVVAHAARRTNEAVDEAKAVVEQVAAGISEIRAESKEVADAIRKLNEDLREVSKIAQVINQVAERSDLLALNAALEGTKAGDVGRGFSLVAAEMRKLAENVSVSARDIGRIVETIQESGNQAVAKATLGVDASDRGVQVAAQASEVFQRIMELARGTTEAALQITTATRQQRQSSDQAVQGARNVAELVKQGVDATGRTTRIAQDLEGVATALSALTGRFKVDRERA
ncbi:MAG TPA: methyl-accepting chemotaxis protein, partial [Myxococcaceae bacterium]|nr:methyl-accepting chemotaxis protein [Myxococcaceae bacterium]